MIQRIASIARYKWVRWLITMLTFALSAGILGYLIYSQRDLLLSHAWAFRWQPVVLAFLIYTIALWMNASVWVSIIKSFGIQLSFKKHFRYYCISNLARRLPGTVWYIAYRAHFYRQEGLSARVTSIATAIEFAVSSISAALASLVFAIPVLTKYPWGIGLAVVLLVICVAFLQPRVMGWLLRRAQQPDDWYDLKRILRWTGIYSIFWAVGGTLFYATANVVYPIPLENLSYVIGTFAIAGLVGRAVTFLPSNFGLQELSYSLTLSVIMPASMGLVVALVNRIMMISFEIIWTLLSLWLENREQRAINPK